MKTTKILFGILAGLLIDGGTVRAQNQAPAEEQKEKIHIELRSVEGGDSKVFEKDYNSKEEMLADRELKDFLNGEDLDVYFFGDKSKNGLYSFRLPGPENEFHVWRGDSLRNFRFGEDSAFSFIPDFGKGFMYPLQGDRGIHFWLPFHPDSMYTLPLKPHALDSIRKIWEENLPGSDNQGFFYHFDDKNEDVYRRLDIIGEKKVTISELKDGEEALAPSSKKMAGLVPEQINFFPNPGNGRFSLVMELKPDKPVQVSIAALSGQVVYEEEIKIFDGRYRREFDLREKEEGIYLLRVIQGNSSLVRKIMIN